MKNLRRYIRMLVEAAVTGQQAVRSGLALYRRQSGDFTQYVLYKPDVLVAHLEDESSSTSGIVLGYMQVRARNGDCNNASQVKASWSAPGGYGPLMYDLAMADSQSGIMPDRGDTSPSAANVWKYYYYNREDVMAVPFEDREEDTSRMSPEEKQSLCDLVGSKVLDHSYSGSSAAAQLGELQVAHNTFMKSLKVDRKSAEDILFDISNDLFNKAT